MASKSTNIRVGRSAGTNWVVTANDAIGATDSLTAGGPQIPTGGGYTRVQDLSGGHLNNATTGIITFPSGTYADASDFVASSYPVYGYALIGTGVTGLIGTGVDSTIISVIANTMSQTSADKIPAQSTNGTNPLWVMRMDGGGPSKLTIKGTTQTVGGVKQLYNGIELYQQTSTNVGGFKVINIPGDNAANPGETFSVASYRCSNQTLHDIEVDGTNGAGTKVGGTGLGLNFSSGTTTVNDCNLHDMGYGHGFSAYQCTGTVNFNRIALSGSPGCANFERNVITSTLTNCNFTSTKTGTNKSHMIVDSDLGSSTINIVEPSFDTNTTYPGQFVVCIHSTYQAGQKQLATDIHLTLGGVTYTPTASANYNQTGVGSFGPLRIVQHGAFG